MVHSGEFTVLTHSNHNVLEKRKASVERWWLPLPWISRLLTLHQREFPFYYSTEWNSVNTEVTTSYGIIWCLSKSGTNFVSPTTRRRHSYPIRDRNYPLRRRHLCHRCPGIRIQRDHSNIADKNRIQWGCFWDIPAHMVYFYKWTLTLWDKFYIY